MISKYINLNINNNLTLLKEPGKVLSSGGLVIFPTETVYGIGANALNNTAVDNIFKAKGRASDNPMIVHISNTDMLNPLVTGITNIEQKLINAFWPGPLTIVLPKSSIIPNNVSANLDTIGIRMPNNEIALKLIDYAGVPIAAPSANISGRPSGTKIEDIINELDGKVDYIIDAGITNIGLESTVVRVIDGTPHILRPGKITEDDIRRVVGNVILDSHILEKFSNKEEIRSPGIKYKHYAPKTKCTLVYSQNNDIMVNKINEISSENGPCLVLGTSENLKKYTNVIALDLGSKNNLSQISQNIFTLLRQVDSYNVNMVIIEGVNKHGLGLAIMNRLLRACNYNYIELI